MSLVADGKKWWKVRVNIHVGNTVNWFQIPPEFPPFSIVERLSQTFFVPQSWKFKGPTAAVIVMLDDPRWRQLRIIEFHDHISATIKPLHCLSGNLFSLNIPFSLTLFPISTRLRYWLRALCIFHAKTWNIKKLSLFGLKLRILSGMEIILV